MMTCALSVVPSESTTCSTPLSRTTKSRAVRSPIGLRSWWAKASTVTTSTDARNIGTASCARGDAAQQRGAPRQRRQALTNAER